MLFFFRNWNFYFWGSFLRYRNDTHRNTKDDGSRKAPDESVGRLQPAARRETKRTGSVCCTQQRDVHRGNQGLQRRSTGNIYFSAHKMLKISCTLKSTTSQISRIHYLQSVVSVAVSVQSDRQTHHDSGQHCKPNTRRYLLATMSFFML